MEGPDDCSRRARRPCWSGNQIELSRPPSRSCVACRAATEPATAVRGDTVELSGCRRGRRLASTSQATRTHEHVHVVRSGCRSRSSSRSCLSRDADGAVQRFSMHSCCKLAECIPDHACSCPGAMLELIREKVPSECHFFSFGRVGRVASKITIDRYVGAFEGVNRETPIKLSTLSKIHAWFKTAFLAASPNP